MSDIKKDNQELSELFGEAIQKNFGPLNELVEKQAGELKYIKTAMEKFNLGAKEVTPEFKEFKRQKFFVDLFRKVHSNNVVSDE